MLGVETVTLREAQYLLGRPQEEINRAIDRGEVDKLTEVVIEPAKVRKKKRPKPRGRTGRRRVSANRVLGYAPPATVKRTVRKLGTPELLYLALEGQARQDLTPAGRRKLYAAIKAQEPGAKTITVGPFELPLKRTAKALAARYRGLKAVRAGIFEAEQGDPVLKDSNISVYLLAALAEGQSMNEILEDFPGLTERKVQLALDYARAYPKKGRPYPQRSFKRMAASLAASGALDLPPDVDDEQVSPSDFE